jgi:hypothetical protein
MTKSPNFCKFDGKELVKSKQTIKLFYSEQTGKKQHQFHWCHYCPDWQQGREDHTVWFSSTQSYYLTEDIDE